MSCIINGKQVTSIYAGGKSVHTVKRNGIILWQKTTPVVTNYLTFTAGVADSWVTFDFYSGTDVEYRVSSTDESDWESYTSATRVDLSTVGSYVQFRGTNVFTNSSKHFTMGGSIAASGSVTSLLDRVGSDENVTLYNSCCGSMFFECYALTSAPELPAKTMRTQCYHQMFYRCTGLTTPPVLPSTTLAYGCYYNMFVGCTNLKSAPALPATTLYTHCYHSMFQHCPSITTPPVLPATTMAPYCYEDMFVLCTGLTSTPELKATTLAENCYASMFMGCENITTPTELPATTLATKCYYQMFRNCKALTTAPSLPAETMTDYGYYGMFWGCTALATAPWIGATTTYSTACGRMFYDCNALTYVKTAQPDFTGCTYWLPETNGTFHCTTTLKAVLDAGVRSASTVPETWNVVDDVDTDYLTFTAEEAGSTVTFAWYGGSDVMKRENYGTWTSITSGDTTTLASVGDNVQYKGTNVTTSASSHFSMTGKVAGSGSVTSLTDGVGINASVTLTNLCYRCMFFNCSSLTTAPSLPAMNLATACYYQMFVGCTNLQQIPELPATTLKESCYYAMFGNCYNLSIVENGTVGIKILDLTEITSLPTDATTSMFELTGGSFKGDPSTGNAYYYITDADYLTLTSDADTASSVTIGYTSGSNMEQRISTSGVLSEWTAVTSGTTASLPSKGDYVQYRGTDIKTDSSHHFSMTGTIKGSGSVTSLTDRKGTNPNVVLQRYIYSDMFFDCSALTQAPKLISKNLAVGCYAEMFNGCTSLAFVHELPATTLSENCYFDMFYRCRALKVAKDDSYGTKILDLTSFSTLPTNAVFYMFSSTGGSFTGTPTVGSAYYIEPDYLTFTSQADTASSVTIAYASGTDVAQRISTSGVLSEWTAVTSGTTASLPSKGDYVQYRGTDIKTDSSHHFSMTGTIKGSGSVTSLTDGRGINPDVALGASCYASMFEDCTSLTYAPPLYALTLSENCYVRMFAGCTALTGIPLLSATTLADGCYQEMFSGCSLLKVAENDGLGTKILDLSSFTSIPTTATTNMFAGTCGAFTGTPTAGNAYAIEPTADYLTLTSDADTASSVTIGYTSGNNVERRVYLSGVPSNWTSIASGTTVSLPSKGDRVQYRGTNVVTDTSHHFSMTGTIKGSGSVTSLTDGTGVNQNLTLNTGCYCGMFRDCSSLTLAPTLKAKTMSTSCYANMFEGCTTLASAPELPATTLATSCYNAMFKGCTALKATPTLSVSTLAPSCYQAMFWNCTSLTLAPTLSATVMATSCYESMFASCTSIIISPALPATTLAVGCYLNMFRNCSSIKVGDNATANGLLNLSSFSSIPSSATTDMFTGTSGSFTGTPIAGNSYYLEANYLTLTSDADTASSVTMTYTSGTDMEQRISTSGVLSEWTAVTSGTTASLPSKGDYVQYRGTDGSGVKFAMTGLIKGSGSATSLIDTTGVNTNVTLGNQTFSSMFSLCTALTTPPVFPAVTMATRCYRQMFNGCTALTTAPVLPATNLATGCYQSMFYGCTALTRAPELITNKTLSIQCYDSMFYGCTALTRAPELKATALNQFCYRFMFDGCTALTDIPSLPLIPTLYARCYYGMYKGCSSLKISENASSGKLVLNLAPLTSIPSTATTDMFTGTSGSFTGTPTVGNAYYLVT